MIATIESWSTVKQLRCSSFSWAIKWSLRFRLCWICVESESGVISDHHKYTPTPSMDQKLQLDLNPLPPRPPPNNLTPSHRTRTTPPLPDMRRSRNGKERTRVLYAESAYTYLLHSFVAKLSVVIMSGAEGQTENQGYLGNLEKKSRAEIQDLLSRQEKLLKNEYVFSRANRAWALTFVIFVSVRLFVCFNLWVCCNPGQQ